MGIGGSYLTEMHTLKHVREFYNPLLWDMSPFDSWVAGGKKDLMTVALEKAEKVLSEHKPEPLDADTSKALDRIIDDF